MSPLHFVPYHVSWRPSLAICYGRITGWAGNRRKPRSWGIRPRRRRLKVNNVNMKKNEGSSASPTTQEYARLLWREMLPSGRGQQYWWRRATMTPQHTQYTWKWFDTEGTAAQGHNNPIQPDGCGDITFLPVTVTMTSAFYANGYMWQTIR